MDDQTPKAEPKAEASASTDDVEKNKIFAILAYFGILWLVPLLAAKDSPYAQFHANQGLVLFLFSLPVFIPFLGWLWGIVTFVLFVMGVVNAASGHMKRLPIIGGINILK